MNNTPTVDLNLDNLYKDSGITPQNNREKLIFVYCLEKDVLSRISSVEPVITLNTDMVNVFKDRLNSLEKVKIEDEKLGYSIALTVKDINEALSYKKDFEEKLTEAQEVLSNLKNLLAEIQLKKTTLTG